MTRRGVTSRGAAVYLRHMKHTLALALAIVIPACGASGGDVPPARDADGGATGPLAGHPLVGRWRRAPPVGMQVTEYVFAAEGTQSYSQSFDDAGCEVRIGHVLTVDVMGGESGTLLARMGPYAETTTRTCPGVAPSTSVRMLRFVGTTPQPYTISGAVLVLGTARYERIP